MINLIACVGKNYELGKNGDLCWRFKSDLEHFKNCTTGHTVIMGYNTYKSLGFKPLRGRYNIVVTRELFADTSVEQILESDLQNFLETIKDSEDEFWIIGGGKLYRQTIGLADRIVLTLVPLEDPEADTYFPSFNEQEYADPNWKILSDGLTVLDYRKC